MLRSIVEGKAGKGSQTLTGLRQGLRMDKEGEARDSGRIRGGDDCRRKWQLLAQIACSNSTLLSMAPVTTQVEICQLNLHQSLWTVLPKLSVLFVGVT